MGNASGRAVNKTSKHMHKGHMHSSKHMRTHRHHYKNRTHRHRRYHGGLSPSKLSKVVSASAASLEESTTDSLLSPKKFTRRSKKVRTLEFSKNPVNPVLDQYVNAARDTRIEIEAAKARDAAAKQPPKKRSPGKSAQPLIDMKIMSKERKAISAMNKANKEAPQKDVQKRGTFIPMKRFDEE